MELENVLGVQRVRHYPPERPLLPGDVRVQAEHDAAELRQRIGFGTSPIADLITVLEMELGVRVYVRRIDSRISGVFAYDEPIGACMLLNANHPRDRRTQTAAHETGHFLSSRREPEILHAHAEGNSRDLVSSAGGVDADDRGIGVDSAPPRPEARAGGGLLNVASGLISVRPVRDASARTVRDCFFGDRNANNTGWGKPEPIIHCTEPVCDCGRAVVDSFGRDGDWISEVE